MESSASSEPAPASARPRGLRSVQQALELGQLAGTVAAVGVKEVEVELRGMINNVRHLGGKRGVTTAEYITSIHKHKTHVGSTFIHEKHGTGKLAEITANGDFVMQFDSGDVHTYQPKSIYKLRPVSEAQLKKMKAGASKGGKMAGSKMFNDLQERMELYRTLMSGHPVQVDLDATVEEVVDASKVLGKSAPGGADEEHAIWQAGVLVNKHKWSTLQYHCHPRLGTVTVRLKVEKWGETDIVMFMCRHARTCAPQLLHGGVGAVGNYRDDKAAKKGDKGKKGEKPLAWLLSNADGTDRRFREYFIQSSHNSYILGRQLQVYGAGGRPVNIVYSEAMPIALNLGYRVLELDVWGSSSTPSQLVRHGPYNALSNSVPLLEMLEAVETWMQHDEEADAERLRLPLAFSIENNHSTDDGEKEMASLFKEVFRNRLVPPTMFIDPTLRELASVQRRVVIKSCSWKGADTVCAIEWAQIVAMWKPVAHPLCTEALVCKSVDAPSMGLSAKKAAKRVAKQAAEELLEVAEAAEGEARQAAEGLMEQATDSLTALADSATTTLPQLLGGIPAPAEQQPTSEEQGSSQAGPSVSESSDGTLSRSGTAPLSPGKSSARESSAREMPGSPARRPSSLTRQSTTSSLVVGPSGLTEGQDDMARALGLKIAEAVAKVAEKRAKKGLGEVPTIIRVYPPAVNQNSENYDPTGAFDVEATITALNIQGRGRSGLARLSAATMRGGLAPVADRCDRDKVRSVEAVFVKHGYDGYMPIDAWQAGARADFLKKLGTEVRSSVVGQRLLGWASRRRAVPAEGKASASAAPVAAEKAPSPSLASP